MLSAKKGNKSGNRMAKKVQSEHANSVREFAVLYDEAHAWLAQPGTNDQPLCVAVHFLGMPTYSDRVKDRLAQLWLQQGEDQVAVALMMRKDDGELEEVKRYGPGEFTLDMLDGLAEFRSNWCS